MVDEGVLLGVSILVHETLDTVSNGTRVVLNTELLFPFPSRPFDKALVIAELALYVG